MIPYRLPTITIWSVLALTVFTQSAGAEINVRDYGAKGDNVTDDTTAIRAAVEAAQKAYKLTKFSVPGGHGGLPTRPEIVFPSGRYLISEAIYIAGGVIRGEGEALIIQKHEDKDLITSQNAWRMTISGLTFVGGRNQLQLSNRHLGECLDAGVRRPSRITEAGAVGGSLLRQRVDCRAANWCVKLEVGDAHAD